MVIEQQLRQSAADWTSRRSKPTKGGSAQHYPPSAGLAPEATRTRLQNSPIPVLSEQECASCVDKQTHAELSAGFFLRSMTTPRQMCTSQVPSTHSSFSVPPGKTRTLRRVNRSKTLPPSMTARFPAHTTPKSDSRLTTLSKRQHGVLPTSRRPLKRKRCFSPKQHEYPNCTLRVSKLYP